MSDRRPENRPLFVGCPTHPEHADRKHDYMGNLSNYGDPCSFQLEPVTVADLLAAVRAGVESGTIKGEVVEWCVNHNLPALPDKPTVCFDEGMVWAGAIAHLPALTNCRIAERLLLADSGGFRYSCGDFGDWRTGPVSDGGSET